MAGGNRRSIPGLHNLLLIVGVDDALGGADEAGAHLDAHRAQGQGGGQSSPVGKAAGGDHRDVHRVHDLGDERHGGHIADVPAGFHPLGDQRIHTHTRYPPGQGYRADHRYDGYARFFQWRDDWRRTACAGGHHCYPFLDADVHYVVHVR